jgi:arylsulfatase A-like enzyme
MADKALNFVRENKDRPFFLYLAFTIPHVARAKPVPSDGISFLPTLLGQNDRQKKHEYLYWEYAEKGGQLAIRLGQWKGVKVEMKKNKNAKWELYDLQKDESETTDLATRHPELIAQFDRIVKKEHQPSHVAVWEFVE